MNLIHIFAWIQVTFDVLTVAALGFHTHPITFRRRR